MSSEIVLPTGGPYILILSSFTFTFFREGIKHLTVCLNSLTLNKEKNWFGKLEYLAKIPVLTDFL